MGEAVRQWPDNIVSGNICYGRAYNYDGFYLADVSHGIPTIGSVQDGGSSPLLREQRVQVFNYPGQTEAIAKQLVHRWNKHVALVEALKALPTHWLRDGIASDPRSDGLRIEMRIVGTTYKAEMTLGELRAAAAAIEEAR